MAGAGEMGRTSPDEDHISFVHESCGTPPDAMWSLVPTPTSALLDRLAPF